MAKDRSEDVPHWLSKDRRISFRNTHEDYPLEYGPGRSPCVSSLSIKECKGALAEDNSLCPEDRCIQNRRPFF